jgi:single-stranded-DNA-specific exonuclease
MLIDAEVSLAELSTEAVYALEKLGPHGYGNPQPVFVARNTGLSAPARLLQEKHLKLRIVQQGCSRDAIGWRKAEWFDQVSKHMTGIDLAFHASLNHFQNRTETQLELLDLKISSSS